MKNIEIYNKLKNIETSDYQNRGGSYPKADVPDTIDVWKDNNDATTVQVSFKNTDEDVAKEWLEKRLRSLDIDDNGVQTYQDGDYYNDWVVAMISIQC